MIDHFVYGEGQLVVLCHSAASHSGQWKQLIDLLSPTYKVVAFDQFGYRDSADWPYEAPMLFDDQARPIFDYISDELSFHQDRVHLVGHSHGASIAANVAILLGNVVQSLSLYEPNSFGALIHDPKRAHLYDSIIQSFGDLTAYIDNKENWAYFASELMTFWLGDGGWKCIPDRQKQKLILLMPQALREVYAALHSPFNVKPLQRLGSKVLVMYDRETPSNARVVSEHYTEQLQEAQIKYFDGCGHLGPISHADKVNSVIKKHIVSCT